MATKDDKNKVTKLQLKTDEDLWRKVSNYKMVRGLHNNNDAVEELLKKGLAPSAEKDIIYTNIKPTDATIAAIKEFNGKIPSTEKKETIPLLVCEDKRSGAFYCECHLSAKDFVELSDPDATIDPELQEDYRANRELEPENYYFLQMIEDAKGGRQFSDIVIEYNTEYNQDKPLKILGGQHRYEAIKRALKENAGVIHGIKVHFNLSKDQRAEIMRISNTNINVSPDLRDRIEETRLTPANMLRDFCQSSGILKTGEDFGDKRRSEDFSPTVRMMRSFIVNFYEGRNYAGNVDDDAAIPYLCESGRRVDEKYLHIFTQFKSKKSFDDPKLIEAAKMFAKLHETQYKNSEKFKGVAKKEYRIKAFGLSIIASWAFAAGALQKFPDRLTKLYNLPTLSENDDPLNAVAMGKARHKTDSDTYRGLGTRNDKKEVGRVLQLFVNYSSSPKPKITEQMCNAAIDVFHANEGIINSQKKRREAFE